MPLNKELLAILVCPETKEPLAPASPELLARVNAAVAAGTASTRSGSAVEAPLDEGLLRQDGRVLYAVRDGIPIMLLDEAIDLSGL